MSFKEISILHSNIKAMLKDSDEISILTKNDGSHYLYISTPQVHTSIFPVDASTYSLLYVQGFNCGYNFYKSSADKKALETFKDLSRLSFFTDKHDLFINTSIADNKYYIRLRMEYRVISSILEVGDVWDDFNLFVSKFDYAIST